MATALVGIYYLIIVYVAYSKKEETDWVTISFRQNKISLDRIANQYFFLF